MKTKSSLSFVVAAALVAMTATAIPAAARVAEPTTIGAAAATTTAASTAARTSSLRKLGGARMGDDSCTQDGGDCTSPDQCCNPECHDNTCGYIGGDNKHDDE